MTGLVVALSDDIVVVVHIEQRSVVDTRPGVFIRRDVVPFAPGRSHPAPDAQSRHPQVPRAELQGELAEVAAGAVDGVLRRWEGEGVDVVVPRRVVRDVFVFVTFAFVAGAVRGVVHADVGGDRGVADVWTDGVVAVMTHVVGVVPEAVPRGVTGAGVDVVVDSYGEIGYRHPDEGGQQ